MARRKAAKGNKTLATSFKDLAKSAGVFLLTMVGFNQLRRVAGDIFQTTKQLDAIDFAINKVIKDQLELASTHQFLSRITRAYGAELISTTNRYIKFAAAAKQSGVSIADTQNIFDSMTKISGTLGLRTEELTGVYLALEQMLSKGKVTTEELRRQLGERIPGAMGIMAKAVDKLNPEIDVTISVLDNMLKKGEVLSGEVLPEFARQAEKAFGVETVTKVETLIAAQNRLTLSWQDFVKQLNAAPIIARGLDLIADAMERIKSAIETDENLITTKTNKRLTEAFKLISEAGTAEEKRAKVIEIIGNLQRQQISHARMLKENEDARDKISGSVSN
ncbi:MAG: tape measure protein, partial [Candidatus Heimdallarchaeota archaeon]|nr:tape measure protein [Candidatus Heimdallarchaeota archaeon]